MSVSLSSPDKVLWPERGLTKRDLWDYLHAAADRILPHIAERPLSLKRFPRGIQAPGFFQKDLPDHAPQTIRRWRVWAESADREVAYALVDDVEGLAWLAQQNTVELHPALMRVDMPGRADWLVFDVDPGSDPVPPASVARWIAEVLSDVGLRPRVKTSGGRGLHVMVPLERRYDQDLLRPLTLALARMVVERHPDELTVEMRKAERGGRTLVDWSRGGNSTLIAPWSPRAHPNATVSMPLRWEEVDEDLDPTRFTLTGALERDDAWVDAPGPQRLEQARDAVLEAGYPLEDISPRGATSRRIG